MKITVLNGSPKGRKSVTLQYVHYIQKGFPQHELKIFHISQRLEKIEKEDPIFQEILESIRLSDGILWSSPVYYFLIPSNFKKFIELIFKKGHANLAGMVTDESGDSAEIDHLLETLAGRLVRFAENQYIKPISFLRVGGEKLFRDQIWGHLRFPFRADHEAYKNLGIYDFPQKDYRTRIQNSIMLKLAKVPRIRSQINKRMKKEMVKPLQKVLED